MELETTDHFECKGTNVGVGRKYRCGYDGGEIVIRPGDLVHWKDPDAGRHAGECPCITECEYVARVDCLYAVDYSFEENLRLELGVKAPLGRLSLDDVTVLRRIDIPDHLQRRVDEFIESEATDYMMWEGHYDLQDVPETYREGHRNARPSCWYDDDGYTTHIESE